jgi:hypothetical protein
LAASSKRPCSRGGGSKQRWGARLVSTSGLAMHPQDGKPGGNSAQNQHGCTG